MQKPDPNALDALDNPPPQSPLKIKSGEYLSAPYFEFMQLICRILKQYEGYILLLEPESHTRFECSCCAECCQRPWWIEIPQEYYEKWYDIFDQHPSGDYQQPFILRTDANAKNYAEMRRKPGTSECLFLQDDRSCFIHANYGEEALCHTCRSFPRYEGWFGAYMGQFLLNSCPDTSQLIQKYPRVRYKVVSIKAEAWKSLMRYPHPMGLFQGYLWLGYQLDLAAHEAWTPVQNLRYLAQRLGHLNRLGLQRVTPRTLNAMYEDLKNDTQPGAVPPPPHPNLNQALEWIKHFLEQFTAMHTFLEDLQRGWKNWPRLTPDESQLLHFFMRHYLHYRFVTLNYRYSDGRPIFFQVYFLLALHMAMMQLLILYYRDKDGQELNQEHILRAANFLGYRFEHAPYFIDKYKIDKLSPQDSLNGMEMLLHLDLVAAS